jgi:peptidoglycan hydrolase-like protein with peptidoglycan-binding domain
MLQSQLDTLLATVRSLNAQIQAKTQGSATGNANAMANANANASFKRDLAVGVAGGADVKALQVWLNLHGYAVAGSGAGSQGNETTTFGGLTRAALAKFQKSVGITPAAGYFGAITRGYISTH